VTFRTGSLAEEIAAALDDAAAVARLDREGPLWTASGDDRVPGIAVRPGVGPPPRVVVGLEVVAVPERALAECADAVRDIVRARCEAAGVDAGRIDVRITDLDDGGAGSG